MYWILGLLISIGYLYRWLERRRMFTLDFVEVIDDNINDALKDFDYFQCLTPEGKIKFRKRVRRLNLEKRFVGVRGLKVTTEMKTRISASLVQLTYGLPSFEVENLHKIIIFPNIFYHPYYRQKLKGFASQEGVVAVSWPDFEDGYDDPDDNYNLGLHELAHALHIDNAQSSSFSTSHFKTHFKYWSGRSIEDFYNLRDGKNKFMRKYGGNNFHEFFAVCIEHFFESPEAFYGNIPDLYIRTCLLLNQDPLNVEGDYLFDPNRFPEIKGLVLPRAV